MASKYNESSLTLSKMVSNIQNTNWSKINNYAIDIHFKDDRFKRISGFTAGVVELNKSIISVNTPPRQNQAVEQYIGFEWKYHQGRDELFRFDMTFRDYDKMTLYKQFRTMYDKSKDQYFDKIALNVDVYLEDDKDGLQDKIFSTETAIIVGVSQLAFSHNTENQIAEFTVNFICKPQEHTSGDTLEGALNSGLSIPGLTTNGQLDYNKTKGK